MNIKEYIESGILELYLTGSLSEKEAAEVIANLNKYPELRTELEAIEKTFVNTSAALGGIPSEDLFDKIESKIDAQSDGSVKTKSSNPQSGLFKFLGLLGLAGIAFGLYTYSQLVKTNDSISQLNQENTELQTALDDCEENQNRDQSLFALKSSATKAIILDGQAASPNSFAIVHWNENDNSVVVDVSGLPSPPSGKEYQLWSLKLNPLAPTDAGVLTNYDSNSSLLFEAKDVASAEGFAITLEPAGGSIGPSLDQLYVLGTI